MDDDWDLHAVVRSCSSTTTTTTTTAVASAVIAAVDRSSCGQNSSNLEQDCSFSESDWSQDLHDLLKPFLPKPLVSPQNKLPISPLSVLGGLQDPSSDPQGIKQFPQQKNQQLFSVVNGSKPSARSKKRKNHQKKVCHVAAENLSSDLWSWRKYGQKPIKGSPYPRGYYRCSTSKGCMARKQVERNRSDPGMFIVTYTGEHSHPMPTHRNSLAGSTRHKSAEGTTSNDSKKESPGAGQLSPALEKLESSPEDLADMEDGEDDEEFGASKVALDDDFFSGLEDFAGEYLSDDFPTNLGLHWLGSNGTAAAAEGAGGGGC